MIFPGRIFDPANYISTHCVLKVSIEKADYLIDIGMGLWAFKYPLKINFESPEKQEIQSWNY